MSSLHTICVLVSGTGRHLENFARLCQAGELPCRIGLVISSKAGVGALEHAERYGLPVSVIDPERALDQETFSREVLREVEAHGCETMVMAGFIRKLTIPDEWQQRTLNIHPSLLPAFGGKGFWGDRVHAAVLARGCQFSGCTVHYVDNEYDHGPILLQRCVEVRPGDTVHDLATRVFAEELVAYPAALRLHVRQGESA